jgi:hypothetical protein
MILQYAEIDRGGHGGESIIDRRPLVPVIARNTVYTIELARQRRIECQRRGEELGEIGILGRRLANDRYKESKTKNDFFHRFNYNCHRTGCLQTANWKTSLPVTV